MRTVPYPLILAIVCLVGSAKCSIGDQLPVYQDCLQYCFYFNCSTRSALKEFNSRQSGLLQLMGWNCEEECNYDCQWLTVDYLLKERNVSNVQFYGKWTFKRYLGIQEPASAIFSLMNLLVYLGVWMQFSQNAIRLTFKNRKYSKFKLKEFGKLCSTDKEFLLITMNGLAALNAWVWSTVFHCKDFSFTEKMDYFSAFLFVTTGFTLSIIKLLDELALLSHSKYVQPSLLLLIISFGFNHASYLLFSKIDYQYNMKVNVALGVSSTAFWIVWCFNRFRKYKCRYLFKCILSLLLMNLFLGLEIFDFPPIYYIFDAHSLWHLGTVFLHPIYYSFLQDEFKFRSSNIRNYKKVQ